MTTSYMTVKRGRGRVTHLKWVNSSQTFCGLWGNLHSADIVKPEDATCKNCWNSGLAAPGIDPSRLVSNTEGTT